MDFSCDHFASTSSPVLSNTTFQKKIHSLYTWRSNDNKTKNQIDYMLIPKRWITSVINTYNTRIFLTDTDHKPVISMIRLRLKAYTKKAKTIRYNLGSLLKPEVAEEFRYTLREMFDAVQAITKHGGGSLVFWGCLTWSLQNRWKFSAIISVEW